MKKRTRGEDATLQAYLREIATFPSLTSEEERDLGRRIRRHRDDRAFRRLVESNLRLVAGYARGYTGLGIVLLDLIDEANVGLMEAARRFDPEADGEFTAYARWRRRDAAGVPARDLRVSVADLRRRARSRPPHPASSR